MFELVSGIVALALTLALLSYLAADNPVYRIAAHLFVGLSAGYAVVLAWHTVIAPRLLSLLAPFGGGAAGLVFGAALITAGAGTLGGALLLLKTLRVGQRLGGLVVALMVGVGAAVAVGGALTGTLIPQTDAALVSLLPRDANGAIAVEGLVEGLFTLVGTLATLGFFWYGGRAEPGSPVSRAPLARPVAALGQVFIAIAFGALYAGALAASVAIFADRMRSIAEFLTSL
jgi:hypothetical protein